MGYDLNHLVIPDVEWSSSHSRDKESISLNWRKQRERGREGGKKVKEERKREKRERCEKQLWYYSSICIVFLGKGKKEIARSTQT